MNPRPPVIDLLPDGSFRAKPRPLMPLSAKMMVAAVVVAAVAASVLVAALAVWVISMVLPVLIIAGAGAWALVKFRRWQLFRGQPGAVRSRETGGFR